MFPRSRFSSRSFALVALRVPLQPLEVGPKLSGGLTTNVAILLKRLVDNLFELVRYVRVDPHWGHRRALQNRIEDQRRSGASKWQRCRAHLIQHRPEREQVCSSVEFLAPHLLRGHIGNRAKRRTGTGKVLLRADGRVAHSNALPLRGDLSQSKIENFRLTSIRHEDIGGLDVPVDDALRMCGVECVRNLDTQLQNLFSLQWLSRDLVFEGFPFEVLHGDEGPSFIFPNVVNRADIRVIECRGSASLPLKALKCLPILGHFVRKELQRDMPT